MDKLLIIDGHAIMHRAFHAIPPLSTPNHEPINAVHGMVNMILKLVQDLRPTAITVVFDEKAPTFRNKALPSYQSQRPPMAPELSSQFDKAKEFLKASKIPVYSMPGYEADDVIGTLAEDAVRGQSPEVGKKNTKLQAPSSNFSEVVIVTGDKDQLQLVDDKKNIKLFMPIGGLANGKLFGETETIERMGVAATQVADLKGLIGDPSDNYKGVPGIGPKTGTDLLSKYKSLENVYKHLEEIKPSVKEKLEKGRAEADLSFKLATIVRDVPIKFDFDKMAEWKLDSPDVIKLFTEEFGFKTITERIKKIGEDLEKEKQGSLF